MSLKTKLPIWVFIVVAAIGIAVIILLLQYRDSVFDEIELQFLENAYWPKILQQKDELSNWNTYRNEKYGFEIKYPRDWEIEEEENVWGIEEENTVSFIHLTYPKKFQDTYLEISISSESAQEALNSFLEPPLSGPDYLSSQEPEEINIDGHKGYKVISGEEANTEETIFLERTNNSNFEIRRGFFAGSTADPDIDSKLLSSEEYSKILNQILSTFKFIEPIDTSDWKTYRNDEYEFEIKFPSDLVLQKNTGETYIAFWGKMSGKDYLLQFGYISQDTLNRIGISYCGTNPGDSRCDNFTSNDLRFVIDWNIETEGALTTSRADILKPEGGMIIINILHSPNQDIRSFFRQILSTFKFIP